MIKVLAINRTHKRNKICLVREIDCRVGIQGRMAFNTARGRGGGVYPPRLRRTSAHMVLQGLGEREHSFPPDPSLPTVTPLQPNAGAGSGEFQTVTTGSHVTVEKTREPLLGNSCNGVTVGKRISEARYLIFPFFPALNVDIATHMDYILAMINASANQRRAKGGER